MIENTLNKGNHPFKSYIFKPITQPKLSADRPINVMLIDDTKKDLELLMDLLSTESSIKFKFFPYTNIKDALVHLEKKQTPDIITLDLVMPSMNGKMVLGRLKALTHAKDIPVIIHSSMHTYDNLSQVNQLGAHAFFEKPLDMKAFKTLFLNKYIVPKSANSNAHKNAHKNQDRKQDKKTDHRKKNTRGSFSENFHNSTNQRKRRP